jgi:hypothetical protein
MLARKFSVPILNLTDTKVRALEQPKRDQETYWDKSLTSFGIRISQGGTRSWVVMLGSEHDRRRVTIGRYPLISLAEARKQAKVLLAEEALGKFRPTRKAFEDAKHEFLVECTRKNNAYPVNSQGGRFSLASAVPRPRVRPGPLVKPPVGGRFRAHSNPQHAVKGGHWPKPTVKPKHVLVEVCWQVLW